MLVATVVALTGVIYGAEVYMERRVAVASHIDPGGGSRGVMTKVKRKGSLADAVQVSLCQQLSPLAFANDLVSPMTTQVSYFSMVSPHKLLTYRLLTARRLLRCWYYP